MSPTVSITCFNFQLRDELRAQIHAVVEKLLHMDIYVGSARLTLESDYDHKSQIIYRASLVVELRGSEIVVSNHAGLPMPAVKSIVDQAERLLLMRQAEKAATTRSTPGDKPALAG